MTLFENLGEGVDAPYMLMTGCPLGCADVALGSRVEGHATREDAATELQTVINGHIAEAHAD